MEFNKKFGGVYTALLTPFDAQGRVNQKALSDLIKFNLNMGVTGFYVCGSTAEVFLLSDEERRLVYELVAAEAGGKCTLLAHVGALSTDAAIGYAQLAERLGYDAISSVAPFYYKYTFPELKKYYFDIVERVSLPMIVYHFPNFSGVSLTADAVGEFLSDPRFAGLKYTSSDYFMMEQIKSSFPDKVVYNGFDETFLAGISMGADGGIGSTYNFMADKFVRIKSLVEQDRIEEARALQSEANKIITVLCKLGVMQAEKEVLCQMGLDFGCCRPPFAPLSSDQKLLIEQQIMPYVGSLRV